MTEEHWHGKGVVVVEHIEYDDMIPFMIYKKETGHTNFKGFKLAVTDEFGQIVVSNDYNIWKYLEEI